MRKKKTVVDNVYQTGDPSLAYCKDNNVRIDIAKLEKWEKEHSCYEKGHYDAHAAPWMRCG